MIIDILRFNEYILLTHNIQPSNFWDGDIKTKHSKLHKEVIKAKSYKNYDNILRKYNLI